MRMNIYSIFDSATEAYMRPFFSQSDKAALRSFGDISVDAEHPIGQHPQYYTLVRIGTWCDNKGKIVGEMVESVATALEMVAQSQKVDRQKVVDLQQKIENGEIQNGVERT